MTLEDMVDFLELFAAQSHKARELLDRIIPPLLDRARIIKEL